MEKAVSTGGKRMEKTHHYRERVTEKPECARGDQDNHMKPSTMFRKGDSLGIAWFPGRFLVSGGNEEPRDRGAEGMEIVLLPRHFWELSLRGFVLLRDAK
ncbi:MAG: hypothetical protein LBO79_04060 [Zoogloeaceae bacterium]|nr:hypothetical protein [Zoogloeaceae bacterium]